jgi:uncharacterized protein (DUF4415 family)
MASKPGDDMVKLAGLHSALFRPVKLSTTLRIDADVLQWLKKDGKGYQTRINTLLRAAMNKDSG